MERVIKFRGLSVYNNNWLHGSLVNELHNSYIVELVDQTKQAISMITVKKESVGQFTGLYDKNGVEIYEGDIVRFWTNSTRDTKTGVTAIVTIEHGLLLPFYDSEYTQDEQGDWFIDEKGFEIIGNIHQNPELL